MRMAIILTTYDNMENARKISSRIVQNRRAACATILRCDSIYEWKGQMQDEPECMVFYKTAESQAASLIKEVADTHPYETPEIGRILVADVHQPYAAWLLGQLR